MVQNHPFKRKVCLAMSVIPLTLALVNTPAGASTPSAPGSPSVVSWQSSGVNVSWTAATGTVTGYTVSVMPGGETCVTTATHCLVPGVPASTQISISVVAESSSGPGPTSATTTTQSPTPASVPISLYSNLPSPQNFGTQVSFIAQVPSTVSGVIAFYNGGVAIPGCISQLVTSGFAECITNSLVRGSNNAITATLVGSNYWLSSTSNSLVFNISSTTLLTPALLSISTVYGPGNVALTLATVGGSGSGAISYSAVNGTATGCAVSGATLTMATGGTCIVTATQASDGTYLPQTSSAALVTFFASYASTYTLTGYSCYGSDTLNGTTCLSSSSVQPIYTCSTGSPASGSSPYECTQVVTESTTGPGCQTGTKVSSTQCQLTLGNTYPAAVSTSCSAGYTPSGSSCTKTVYDSATSRKVSGVLQYSCPSGDSPAGYYSSPPTCSHVSTVAPNTTFTCAPGDSDAGSTCTHLATYGPTSPQYMCNGVTVFSPSCTVNIAPAQYTNWTCSNGYLQYGAIPTNSCSYTALANYGYTCTPGDSISGYNCTIAGGAGPNIRLNQPSSLIREHSPQADLRTPGPSTRNNLPTFTTFSLKGRK